MSAAPALRSACPDPSPEPERCRLTRPSASLLPALPAPHMRPARNQIRGRSAHAGRPPILAAEHVSLRFGGVRALTDVSFGVRRGEVFSIIGPNGAGKTSMVNCISGRYRPTEGKIHFDGRGHHPRADAQGARRARHRPHLPEPGAVRPHDRARQHHGRPAPSAEARLPDRHASTGRRRAAARNSHIDARSRRSSTSSRSSMCGRRPPARSPTGCASGSSWRARWR